MRSLGKYILLCFILSASFRAVAQVEIGIKVLGFAYHFKKSNYPHLYKLKLDKSGRAVFFKGLMFFAEYNIPNSFLAVRFVQSGYADCAGKAAGVTHIGLRANVRSDNHFISAGFGPTWFYRENWKGLEGYSDEGIFTDKGKWQTLFAWYGAEVEYNHINGPYSAISVTMLPAIPELAAFAIGFRTISSQPFVPPSGK